MSGSRRVISIVVGCAAFVALFPFSGDDSDPPTHRSVFGYEVPGGIWLPLVAGVIAGALCWWALRGRDDAG